MKPLRRLSFALLAVGCLLGLSSCGGSSGSGRTASADNGPPQIAIVLAKSTPAVTTGKITKLVTPLGAFAVGAKVEVPTLDAKSEAIVMATDKDGNIVMATLLSASQQSPDITASTTALTICRLMLGPLPTGVDHIKMNSAIQSAPEFSHLVSLVDAAFAAGILPQDYNGVGQSVSLVLSQATAQVKPVSATSAMAAGKLSTPTVTTPLPYIVETAGPFGVFNIKVTAANTSVLGADVSNGFPIQFAAYGTKADGSNALVPTGSDAKDGYVQLPASELYKFGTPVPVPGTGAAWNLTVRQTTATRHYNGRKLLADFIGAGIAVAGLDETRELCIPKIIATAVSPDSVAPWADASSGEDGWNYYMDYVSQGAQWKNIGETLYDCAKQSLTNLPAGAQQRVSDMVSSTTSTDFARRMAPIFTGASKLLKGLSKVEAVYETTNALTTGWAFFHYWNFSKTVGICGRTDAATVIANCAASLSLTPGTASVLVGDQKSFTANALDANGKPTLTPKNLVWSSSNPTVATIDPVTDIVTAVSASPTPVTITATDPVTGATGSATFKVGAVSASVSIAPQSIALGGTATLTWSSENATACTASGSWNGALATSGTHAVTPLATGTYNYGLSCDGPGGPALASTSLVVAQPPTGGTTYSYASKPFDLSIESTTPLAGRVLASVTFKRNMSVFSGTAYKADIASITMSVDGQPYGVTYTGDSNCLAGEFSFQNGEITKWWVNVHYDKTGCPVTETTDRRVYIWSDQSTPNFGTDAVNVYEDYDNVSGTVLAGATHSRGTWTRE